MELRRKLKILAEAARFDASCAGGGASGGRPGGPLGVITSTAPGGRTLTLLKVLLSNECIHDCRFCENRATSDVERATFTPHELARLTIELHRRNHIQGIFLSSGVVRSADHTMEQMVETARLLREEHHFGGYIHLKAVPGASVELLDRAARHADRMSANIELPTEEDLQALAPGKHTPEIESAMQRLAQGESEARGEGRPQLFLPAGQTTQMIVGATPTTDAVILSTAARLYERHGLRRVYYSAYIPTRVADGGLPAQGPPRAREQRLYEADWLIRRYGFEVGELATPAHPSLDLDLDPKLAWALRHRHLFPVDVNRAPRELLLRVPGVGERVADRMLAERRRGALTLDALARLGVVVRRARFFVTTVDANPDALLIDRIDLRERLLAPPGQLVLFGAPLPTRHVKVDGLDDFRRMARALIGQRVPPEQIRFEDAQAQLGLDLDPAPSLALDEAPSLSLPRAFVERCEVAARHLDPVRWSVLYRLAFRLATGERGLMNSPFDPDLARLQELERDVWRDVERALEQVRFQLESRPEGETLVARHAPRHRTLALVAWALAGRLRQSRWRLVTPQGCAVCEGGLVSFVEADALDRAPAQDEIAALIAPRPHEAA